MATSRFFGMLLLGFVAMAMVESAAMQDSEFDEVEDDDEVSNTLNRAAGRIEEILNDLERVSNKLDGNDEALEIGKRGPPAPAHVYAPLVGSDGKPFKKDKHGLITGGGDENDFIPNMFTGILKNGVTDEQYEGLIKAMVAEKANHKALEPYRLDSGGELNWGAPFGFFDLREFGNGDIDSDKVAEDYFTKFERSNRVANGPRGFYFYGPTSYAAAIAENQKEIVEAVEYNAEAEVDACQQDTQVANCNWGRPRLNYDEKLPATRPAVDPNSQGHWPQPAVCTNLDYDWDPTVIGNPSEVEAFIIDSGITAHPDFGGRVTVAAERLNTPLELIPGSNHGNHVAGIITSTHWGIAPGVRVTSYRGNNRFLIGTLSVTNAIENIIRRHTALSAARGRPARFVVNMSMGYSRRHPATNARRARRPHQKAVVVASLRQISRAGLYMVHSAGNNNRMYQANACNGLAVTSSGTTPQDQTLAIGAHDIADVRAPFSNQGPCVLVHAPGVDIRSTINGTGDDEKSGTSMAAPTVAGMVVRILGDINTAALPPTPATMRLFIQALAKDDVTDYQAGGPYHRGAAKIPNTTPKRAFFYCVERVYEKKMSPLNLFINTKKGDKGPKGPKGPKGGSAAMAVSSAEQKKLLETEQGKPMPISGV